VVTSLGPSPPPSTSYRLEKKNQTPTQGPGQNRSKHLLIALGGTLGEAH